MVKYVQMVGIYLKLILNQLEIFFFPSQRTILLDILSTFNRNLKYDFILDLTHLKIHSNKIIQLLLTLNRCGKICPDGVNLS